MSEPTPEQAQADILARQRCTCGDCQDIRKALAHLDDIATSPATMGYDDSMNDARELLARYLGYRYNKTTNRYEVAS